MKRNLRRILMVTYLVFYSFFAAVAQKKPTHVVNDSLQKLIERSHILIEEYRIKESIDYAIKATNYAYEINSDYYKSRAYFLLGTNYEVLVDFKSSEKNYRKALRYAELAKDSTLILWNLNGLGNVYSDGYNNLEESLKFYNRAREIGRSVDDSYQYATPLINLAWTYIDRKEFDKAYAYLLEADKLLKLIGDDSMFCNVKYLFGRYYMSKKKLAIAKKCFNEAIEMARKNDMLIELSDVYKARSELYFNQGDYKNAYYDLKTYEHFKDRLYNKEQLKQIEIAKVSFSVAEYERELESAKKEKNYQASVARNNRSINVISVVGLISLLGAVFFFNKVYRSEKKLSEVLKEKNQELIEAKKEAEKLTLMKSQFISTVSHELRTPLYGVVGITSLLLEDNRVLGKHRKLLDSLKFSGDYLLNLVNNVLQISKIESKKIKLTETPTNILKLSRNLLNSFEYQAKSKNNELVLEVSEDIPKSLMVDSLRLSEILVNLIGNASKFTDDGKIWLRINTQSVTDTHAVLKFEVEDNGVGIPEDKKEYVFEKFSQIHSKTNTSEGTGLGLSIVKNLLKTMNSDIHLESCEGKGTKFFFDIELKIVAEKEEPDNIEVSREVERKKILVAEDNKINQIVTQNLLKIIGYECVIVENGFNAKRMVEEYDFDLVLMDLNMPYMDGVEATKQIREFNTSIPIIALTASELGEVQEECFEIGMNDIINKPLNKDDLKNIILKNLSLQRE
ncbi:ATP-binding protein [Aquimarina hainanensis]|uniref:histidine kinase n=1 Tax=Aquimarina hainanensis TaxID=1578017 RepID=A0ABW5NDI2_9FLAO|nr:ATP-binding protein [Aquimarina sp. TRL1]QKX06413.1 response regulator [Aquimarina sp. TRL1]